MIWLLLFTMILSGFPIVSMAEVKQGRRPLANTIYKLRNEKKLTIGYIGGSITLGSGASNEAYSWRSKITKWFKESYRDVAITDINAGIGGFGSITNVFRAKNQLLKGNPDLVFVEAAVTITVSRKTK